MVKIKNPSFYEDVRKRLCNYLKELLKFYPNVNDDNIISKTQLAKKFRVLKPFVIEFIKKYLRMKHGQRLANKINKEIWTQGP